jgi:hypothetical protein
VKRDDFLRRRKSRSFILKARQLGFTTACLIDMLDDTIFTANINSAIFAHEKGKIIKLFEIVKRASQLASFSPLSYQHAAKTFDPPDPPHMRQFGAEVDHACSIPRLRAIRNCSGKSLDLSLRGSAAARTS